MINFRKTVAINYNHTSDTTKKSQTRNHVINVTGITDMVRAAAPENQQSAYAETKAQISFAVTAKLISAFVFASQSMMPLFSKSKISSF